MTRKVLASLLSLALAVTLVPAVGLVHPEKAEAAGYNANAALSYAASHWNNGSSLCAGFVSECLRAGGINVNQPAVVNLYNSIKGLGTTHTLVKSGNYIYSKYNSGKIVAGDPIFFYCATCNRWNHVSLCKGTDSQGRICEYAHNNYKNGVTWVGAGATICPANHSLVMYSVHFSSAPPTPTAAKPSISFTDIFGGKSATIGSSTSSSTIRYTTNGQSPTANSGATLANWGSFVMSATASVKALATRSGYNPSGVSERWSGTIGTVKTPTISESYSEDGIMVSISADSGAKIFYTTDGTTPTFDTAGRCTRGTEYKSAFLVTKDCTVNAVAGKSGMRNSSKASKSISCTAPASPTVKVSASRIAKGDSVQASWNTVAKAWSYTVALSKDGKEVQSQSTKGTVASFVLDEAGSYTISVSAKNAFGSSENASATVKAMEDCVVRFVDTMENDAGGTQTKVFDRQVVRWGYDATTPTSPSKRGYTFDG